MKTIAIPSLFASACVLAATLTLAGCGREASDPAAAPDASTAALPEGFILSEVPADAVPLTEARAGAAVGEPIVFTGYIGGRRQPFTEGRAIFLAADRANVPSCLDHCATPWDACCVPGDVIAANSATVRIVDADGQTLRLDLQGQDGLVPGATVAVTGTTRETGAVLIVDATGIAILEG